MQGLHPIAGITVRQLVAVGVCLLIMLVLTPVASARRGMTTGFQSDYFQSADAGTRNFWLQKATDAGAGIVRINVPWITYGGPTRPANPADPGTYSAAPYDLTDIDNAVRDARAHGLEVILVPNGAPAWAEGPGKPADAAAGSWRPNPSDFADFTRALAARYSGNFDPDGFGPLPPLPAAGSLEVWNEPNTSGAITPTFQGRFDAAAAIYRDLLNAAYDAVKSVNPRMLVVTGGTAPYGDRPGGPYPPGIQRVRPVTFWEDVLCVHQTKHKNRRKRFKPRYKRTAGCPGPARFDVLAHHPIDNTGGGPLHSGPTKLDASTPDLRRITRVLRGAERVGTAVPGKHPVWVTEFWWDSRPPNPSGAKLGVQARWIEQSLYLFWKAGASLAINFVVGDTTDRPTVHAGFQGGVYFADGRPKPALVAFRFPFVAERTRGRTLRAWGKSPVAGRLRIQMKHRGGWRTLKKLSVGGGSVFVAKLKVPGKPRLRATVGPERSLVWKQTAFNRPGQRSRR